MKIGSGIAVLGIWFGIAGIIFSIAPYLPEKGFVTGFVLIGIVALIATTIVCLIDFKKAENEPR